MNVFVLCTGRCGSKTFAKACEHITNYSVRHESMLPLTHDGWPDNHIEINNRLSWVPHVLPRGATLVQLYRDHRKVIASYHKRRRNPLSLANMYQGIEQRVDPSEEFTARAVSAAQRNIDFLLDYGERFAVLDAIDIDDPEKPFRRFWRDIGAQGDIDAALNEFNTRYNASA